MQPNETIITPKSTSSFRLILKNRELLYFFVWRDFKVKYKQTIAGVGWTIFRPLVQVVVFGTIFGQINSIRGGSEVPYAIFTFTGLLFWTYFSQTVPRVADSLVNMRNIITKIYFPRIIAPVSVTISGLVDFFFALIIFIGLLFYYQVTPGALGIVLFIPMLFLTFITSFGIGLFMATLNAKYRDVQQALPFFIQLLLFLTPVIYSVKFIPEQFERLLFINPMTGVIETVRNTFLPSGQPLDTGGLLISIISAIVILLGAVIFFKKQDRTLVDIL